MRSLTVLLPPARLVAVALLVLLPVALVACDAETPPDGDHGGRPAALTGSAWTVVSVDGRPAPVPGREPTIAFDASTTKGDGGCNSFGGQHAYEESTGQIVIRELAMTARGCLDDRLNTFETAFAQALGSTDHIDIDGQRLVLTGRDHRLVLVARGVDAAS
jgi:heat shock protein HslJ